MATKTWQDGGVDNNWSTAGNWLESSKPSADDDVIMSVSYNCILDEDTATLNSFDMTGYTGTISGVRRVYITGTTGTTTDCILDGTITFTGQLSLKPQGTAIINLSSNGASLAGDLYIGDTASSGTVKQQSAISSKGFRIRSSFSGTYYTNGFSVSLINSFFLSAGTFDFTSSTITVAGVGSYFGILGGSIVSTSSTINMTASNPFFIGGDKSFNNVTFSSDGCTISGNNTFTTLNVNQAGNAIGLKFTAGTTQTVTNFTTNGSSGNLAPILSTSAGSAFTLTTGSDEISVDYMSIKDSTATEATTWYAGANSTDVSGNSGWLFEAPPPPPTFSKFMGVAAASIGKANGVAIASVGKILGIDAP